MPQTKIQTSKTKDLIEDFSFGVLSTAVNLSLGLIALTAGISTAEKTPGSIWLAVENVHNLTGISKDTLKRAFWRAQNQDLIIRRKSKNSDSWIMTEQGKYRLRSALPNYQKKRPWDKKIYLITYDIPEDSRSARDALRTKLVKIGARRFQQSIYLILWNPAELIKKFIKSHQLKGQVIISDIGTSGSIGEMDTEELVWEIFGLKKVNDRYREFLTQVENRFLSPAHLAFLFLSILKDDPQLPFELLGPPWLGDKAYQKYSQLSTEAFKI